MEFWNPNRVHKENYAGFGESGLVSAVKAAVWLGSESWILTCSLKFHGFRVPLLILSAADLAGSLIIWFEYDYSGVGASSSYWSRGKFHQKQSLCQENGGVKADGMLIRRVEPLANQWASRDIILFLGTLLSSLLRSSIMWSLPPFGHLNVDFIPYM